MLRRSVGCAFSVSLAMLFGCRAQDLVVPPNVSPANLVGEWHGLPGPAGFGEMVIYIQAPGLDSIMVGRIDLLRPAAGSAVPWMVADISATPAAYRNTAAIALPIFSLYEVSLTKENCDGDNLIDPNQPLCGFYGKTVFQGALTKDGTLTGTLGPTSCDGYGAFDYCQSVNLTGTVSLHRVH